MPSEKTDGKPRMTKEQRREAVRESARKASRKIRYGAKIAALSAGAAAMKGVSAAVSAADWLMTEDETPRRKTASGKPRTSAKASPPKRKKRK